MDKERLELLSQKFKKGWTAFNQNVRKVLSCIHRICKNHVAPVISKGIQYTFGFCNKYLIPLIRKILSIICELGKDFYFTIRYYCFHLLASFKCPWLPFIRQAEKELKPHAKHLCPQYNWIEKLSIGFLRPALIFVFPSLVVCFLSFAIDWPLLTADKSILTGYLKTFGTVEATFTGFVLTIVAFTITVKMSNLAGAEFLLNGIVRKSAFLPAASFLSGTIMISLVGMTFSEGFSINYLNGFTLFTALLCFFSLIVLVCLLGKTMQTLGNKQLKQLLAENLLWDFRESHRMTIKQMLIQKHFSEKLEEFGYGRGGVTRRRDDFTEYQLNSSGEIVAIDPLPLRIISNKLKLSPLSPGSNKPTDLGYYRTGDVDALITISDSGEVKKETQLALLTKEKTPNKQISRYIQKAFIIKKHQRKQDASWQERIYEMILSSIDKHESSTINAIGSAVTDILDDYLETQAIVAGHEELPLESFRGNMIFGFKPPHPYEIQLQKLVVYAGKKQSQDCLDELLDCIYKLIQTSFKRQNLKHYKDWSFELCWAYHSFRPYMEDSLFDIAFDITRRMAWLSNSFRTEINTNSSTKKINEITPYAIIYLSLCLHILRFSAEKYDKKTFDSVLEHVDKFFGHETGNTKYAKRELDAEPDLQIESLQDERIKTEIAYNELLDHKNLVYVIAGAWLMHKMKDGNIEFDKIQSFLEKLIEKSPDFHDLLDLYAMPRMADMTTNRDNPLGFDNWDWGYSNYPEGRHGTDFKIWISPFYQFLLLKKTVEHPGVYGARLQNIPQTENASHESLKRYLNEIAGENYNLPSEYQSFLGAEKLRAAKERIGVFLSR